MKKLIIVLLLLVTVSYANDSSYYASGNQLIPIEECDVSIQKEILSVKKTGKFIYVTVDYTFYNPVDEKNILVGFEAPSPGGDSDWRPVNGGHPYIHNFKVLMNGKQLTYKKAIVNEENYYQKGKVKEKKLSEVQDFDSDSADFYYVYHFNAKFKKGINKIVHTYKFNVSGSVMENYNFDYILTAANRWANGQIDDFTLNIDMGKNEHFEVANSFCNFDDWLVQNGRKFKHINSPSNYMTRANWTNFVVKDKRVTFKKKDFHPKGELSISSERDGMGKGYEIFDCTQNNLPNLIFTTYYDGEEEHISTKSVDEKSFKILRNLPFALKGYIFKTPFIQDYYMKQKWYLPDPNYKIIKGLQGKELNWYNEVLENKWE